MIDLGFTFAMVTGLYSADSRSALQPVGGAGWIELLHYTCRWEKSTGGSTLIFDIERLTVI